MKSKRDSSHPNFYTGLTSYIFLITGVVLQSNEFAAGKILIITSVILGGIHWIGSIIHVWTDENLKKEETSRYFWLALTIIVPPIIGMMYYLMNRKRISM